MKHYFPLGSPRNKLQADIASTIKEYYPIGVEFNTEQYNSHPGYIKLGNIINEHMTDYRAYIAPWKLFLSGLPKGFKSKINNYGFAHQLSYSGKLALYSFEDEILIRKKSLIFNISWLGNFYAIYGLDETAIKDEKDGRGLFYHTINVITVSPHKEFKSAFNYLKMAIKQYFIGYRFVPFTLCSSIIPEMKSYRSYFNEATVYNSLFSDALDRFYLPSIFLRGDERYGIE